MTEERLDIPVDLDLSDMRRSINLLHASVKAAVSNIGKISSGLSASSVQMDRLAQMTAKTNRVFVAGADGLKIIDSVAQAQQQFRQETGATVALWNRKSKLIDESAGAVRVMVRELDTATQALDLSNNSTQRLEKGFQRVTDQVRQAGNEIVRIKPPDMSGGQSGGAGGGIIKLAAITAGVSAMGKVGTAMTAVKAAAQTASAGMDQFRLAANAPVVNPKLNTLASSITGIGTSLTSVLEGLRGRLDAVLSSPIAALTALRTQLGNLVQVGNDAVAMFARWMTNSNQMTSVLQAFGVSAETTRSIIATMQGAVANATQSGSVGVSRLSGAVAALGGSFENAAGSAQTFNFAAQTVSRPMQMASKWAQAGERANARWAAAKRLMLTPITLVSEAVKGELQSWRLMRAEVDKLPARQRLVTIGMHELYFATRPIRKIFGGVASVSGAVLSPALKRLAQTGSGVKTSFASVARSVQQAASEIRQTVSPTNVLSGAMTRLKTATRGVAAGLARTIGNLKIALVAAGVAAVGFGFNSAIAAEQTEVRFATMLRSGEQAKALLKSLDGFAATTPFAKGELVDATQQLLTAQVPVNQISDKLRILGDIAAGTGKPIVEFAQIFAKVSNTGKVGLEQLNQLAERGVPIYQALGAELGVNRTEMLKMISGGKVGFAQLEAAITSTATGTGMFAGGMRNLSTTTGGLLSTMADNFGGLFKDVGGVLMESFGFNTAIIGANDFFVSLRTGMASLAGMTNQMSATLRSYWGIWVAGASSAFNAVASFVQPVTDRITGMLSGMLGSAGMTFQGFAELAVRGMAMAEFAFINWKTVGAIAISQVSLSAVSFFENLKHFFAAQLPAYLNWFASNWKQVFFTAFDLVSTVFINIGTNIRNAMSAIWDYIKSGGTASLSLAWTPLLDGFQNTVSKLPDIAERTRTEIEKTLSGSIADMKADLKIGMDKHVDGAVVKFKDSLKGPAPLGDDTAPQTGRVDDFGSGGVSKRSNKFVEGIDRGTVEALRNIYSAQGKDNTGKQQLSTQKQMLAEMRKFNSRPELNFGIAGEIA